MAKQSRARVGLLQLGAAVLAMQCLGADGCGGPDYGTVSDIKITYKGTTFATRLPTNQTHFLGTGEILGITEAFTSPDGSVAVGELTGTAPRELMLLSMNSFQKAKPSTAHQFATAVPGKTAKVTWQPNQARLIDHGACRDFFGFFDTSTAPGVFSLVRDTLNRSLFDQMVEGGASDPQEVFSIYQAMHEKDVTPFPANLNDGIMFDHMVEADTPILVPDVRIKMAGRYRIVLVKGFPRAQLVEETAFVIAQRPGGAAAREALRVQVLNALRDQLPPRLNEIVLYGDGTSTNTGLSAPLITNCADKPDDFCGSSPVVRGVIADLLNRSGADGAAISSALSADGFTCRKNIGDEGTPGFIPGDGRCWWHPVFRRVNILPTGIEVVWNNANEPESAELRAVRAFRPNQSHDCITAKPQSAGPIPVLARGDLRERF